MIMLNDVLLITCFKGLVLARGGGDGLRSVFLPLLFQSLLTGPFPSFQSM